MLWFCHFWLGHLRTHLCTNGTVQPTLPYMCQNYSLPQTHFTHGISHVLLPYTYTDTCTPTCMVPMRVGHTHTRPQCTHPCSKSMQTMPFRALMDFHLRAGQINFACTQLALVVPSLPPLHKYCGAVGAGRTEGVCQSQL